MPCGTKQPTNRGFGVAAVCASAVAAGTIASTSGRASATPAPRRTVRRGMCFFVINIVMTPLTGRLLLAAAGCLHVSPERVALHDRRHERREAVTRCRRVARD